MARCSSRAAACTFRKRGCWSEGAGADVIIGLGSAQIQGAGVLVSQRVFDRDFERRQRHGDNLTDTPVMAYGIVAQALDQRVGQAAHLDAHFQ